MSLVLWYDIKQMHQGVSYINNKKESYGYGDTLIFVVRSLGGNRGSTVAAFCLLI